MLSILGRLLDMLFRTSCQFLLKVFDGRSKSSLTYLSYVLGSFFWLDQILFLSNIKNYRKDEQDPKPKNDDFFEKTYGARDADLKTGYLLVGRLSGANRKRLGNFCRIWRKGSSRANDLGIEKLLQHNDRTRGKIDLYKWKEEIKIIIMKIGLEMKTKYC